MKVSAIQRASGNVASPDFSAFRFFHFGAEKAGEATFRAVMCVQDSSLPVGSIDRCLNHSLLTKRLVY